MVLNAMTPEIFSAQCFFDTFSYFFKKFFCSFGSYWSMCFLVRSGVHLSFIQFLDCCLGIVLVMFFYISFTFLKKFDTSQIFKETGCSRLIKSKCVRFSLGRIRFILVFRYIDFSLEAHFHRNI